MKKILDIRFVVWVWVCVASLAWGQEYRRPWWLFYPESTAESQGVSRYYWTEFEVPEGVVSARIDFLLDDGGDVSVDGRVMEGVSSVRGGGKKYPCRRCDLTAVLTPGRHRLELRNVNGQGIGGVLAKVTLEKADGALEEFFSSPDSWRCAKESSWRGGVASSVVPSTHGDVSGGAWPRYYFLDPLYGQVESVQRERAGEARRARLRSIRERLASEENPVVRVEYQLGRPMLRIGGDSYAPILYSSHNYQQFDDAAFGKSVSNFRDAGLHFQVMGADLKDIWRGEGEYDFSLLDFWPWDALLLDPDVRILFDVECRTAPRWWMEAHPEELIVYLDPEGRVSYAENNDKFVAPSFASDLYREELYRYLKALVEYVESQPWGKRVMGYRFDMGLYREWHYYGMSYAPDDSQPMRRKFREFLRTKYGTDEALQKAWGDPCVTLENASMATLPERRAPEGGALYDPVLDARALDTIRCITRTTVDLMVGGDKVIKAACGGRKLVGNYYGYFFGMPFSGVGQHPYLQEVLDSPYVDFCSAPPPYEAWNRDFGYAQISRGIPESFRLRGKLHVVEADTRTHVVAGARHCYAKTPRDTVQLLARDFMNALCVGCGFWYFDFGQGWYGDSEVGEYLKKLRPIWEERISCESAAQVAVVVDMESTLYQSCEKIYLDNAAADRVRYALTLAGAPCDTILSCDLEDPRLPDYQAYIFVNQVRHNPDLVAQARRLRDKGKTLVWLHHAGYLDEAHGAELSGMEELTGIPGIRKSDWTYKTLKQSGIPGADSLEGTRIVRYFPDYDIVPALEVEVPADDSSLQVVQSLPPSNPGGARRVTQVIWRHPTGGATLLALTPFLDPMSLRRLLADAGVHLYYTGTDGILVANQGYVGLHFGEFGGGTRTVTLPRKAQRITQLLPEEKTLSSQEAEQFTFDSKPNTTYLFRVE